MRHYLGVLWRRRWIIVVPLLVLPVVTYVLSKRQPPLYQAFASVLLNNQDQVASSIAGVQTPAVDPQEYGQTQAVVATSPVVVRRVLEAVGRPDLSAHSLVHDTDAYPYAGILYIGEKNRDPVLTKRLAAAFARQYTIYRRQLDTRELARTLDQLQARLAALQARGSVSKALFGSLLLKEQNIRLIEALRQSNVNVLKTPTQADVEQIQPRPLRNTAIALALGLVLGLVLALLVDALDTRVRSADELEEMLGLPLLASVPRSRNSSRVAESPLAVLAENDPNETDAFLTLRTKLALANLELKAHSLLLSSPGDGEGTVTVAANLAAAAARAGSRVVLADLNFRDTALSRLFGLADRPGMTTLALGEATLDDALASVPLGATSDGSSATVSHGGGSLRVLATGPLPPRAGEFVASAAVAAILEDIRGRADLVFVVAPPLLSVGDAVALGQNVDALVLVSRLGSARRTRLRALRRLLATWPTPVLGLVVTGAEPAPARGGGGSGRRLRKIFAGRATPRRSAPGFRRRNGASEPAAESPQ